MLPTVCLYEKFMFFPQSYFSLGATATDNTPGSSTGRHVDMQRGSVCFHDEKKTLPHVTGSACCPLIAPAATVWVHARRGGRTDDIHGYLLTPLILQVSWLTLKIWWGGWWGGFNLSHLLAGDCPPTPPTPQQHHHQVCICLGLVQLC